MAFSHETFIQRITASMECRHPPLLRVLIGNTEHVTEALDSGVPIKELHEHYREAGGYQSLSYFYKQMRLWKNITGYFKYGRQRVPLMERAELSGNFDLNSFVSNPVTAPKKSASRKKKKNVKRTKRNFEDLLGKPTDAEKAMEPKDSN